MLLEIRKRVCVARPLLLPCFSLDSPLLPFYVPFTSLLHLLYFPFTISLSFPSFSPSRGERKESERRGAVEKKREKGRKGSGNLRETNH